MNSFHVLDELCSIIPMTEGSLIRKIRGTLKPYMMNNGDARCESGYDVKKASY